MTKGARSAICHSLFVIRSSQMRGGRQIVAVFDDVPALDVAELDLVAVFQDARRPERLAHHLGAVLAVEILERCLAVGDHDAGMSARDARVVDANGGARLAANRVDPVRQYVAAMPDSEGAHHPKRILPNDEMHSIGYSPSLNHHTFAVLGARDFAEFGRKTRGCAIPAASP